MVDELKVDPLPMKDCFLLIKVNRHTLGTSIRHCVGLVRYIEEAKRWGNASFSNDYKLVKFLKISDMSDEDIVKLNEKIDRN